MNTREREPSASPFCMMAHAEESIPKPRKTFHTLVSRVLQKTHMVLSIESDPLFVGLSDSNCILHVLFARLQTVELLYKDHMQRCHLERGRREIIANNDDPWTHRPDRDCHDQPYGGLPDMTFFRTLANRTKYRVGWCIQYSHLVLDKCRNLIKRHEAATMIHYVSWLHVPRVNAGSSWYASIRDIFHFARSSEITFHAAIISKRY